MFDQLRNIKCLVFNKIRDFRRFLYKHSKKKYRLIIYFGLQGSGKTTAAASIVSNSLYHDVPVYSNVPFTGSYKVDVHNDFGNYHIHDANVIIDEAGLDYNNRNFKNFSDEETYFFKYHRHNRLNIYVFSQTVDFDKKIRDIAHVLYFVKPSIFTKKIIYLKRIKKSIGINEMTKELCDAFSFDSFFIRIFTTKIIFAPLYYKFFNTYSSKKLPFKEFERW